MYNSDDNDFGKLNRQGRASIRARIADKLVQTMNNFKLEKKFLVLYILCVILPLIITDTIIIRTVYEREEVSLRYDMEYISKLYQNQISNTVEYDMKLARSVELNQKINEFLDIQFLSPYEYYRKYYNMINGSFLETMTGLNSDHITIYAENEGILDGEYFKKLSGARDIYWYDEFCKGERQGQLIVYFDDVTVGNSVVQKRKFKYIYELKNYKSDIRKIAVVDNNCSSLIRELKKLGSQYNAYIVVGDYVMFSNIDDSLIYVGDIREAKEPFVDEFDIGGCKGKIYLYNNRTGLGSVLENYRWLIVILIIFTILIPFVALRLISESIVGRIKVLENSFGDGEKKMIRPIEKVDGTDEIAILMHKYNRMAELTNELINTVYKDRIREQESDIAKKNAELLALQSQINPHFLFNALESIRMHSLLKGEEETATMVGKLALMQRQNVEWGNDFVTIRKEMESIEAYLFLQGYRFGERLSFDIDLDESCERYLIPKLTVVTFVENACVHGIESKASPGWIFVGVYKKDANLVLEIEDTGGGMSEEDAERMLENMRQVTIETIKNKKHVGVLNACLRLKMLTDNTVTFDIDSELGVGMSVVITIPLNKLKKMEEGL